MLAEQSVGDGLHAHAALPQTRADGVDERVFECTATLERSPGSRATALISTSPLATSGASCASRRHQQRLGARGDDLHIAQAGLAPALGRRRFDLQHQHLQRLPDFIGVARALMLLGQHHLDAPVGKQHFRDR